MENTTVRPNNWEDLTPSQKVELLKSVTEPTNSANEIALKVNRQFGYSITRNAVIGQANRVGLTLPGLHPKGFVQPKMSPKRCERRTGAYPNRSQTSKPLPELSATKAPKSKPVSFMDLGHGQCKWPLKGKPGPEMMCCGAPSMNVGGTRHSYCAHHRKIGTGGGTRGELTAHKPKYMGREVT